MAHNEACQIFIEQEIKSGLEQGKTPYSIGKELSKWIEKLFEANIPARTIEQKARRIENATFVANNKFVLKPLVVEGDKEIIEAARDLRSIIREDKRQEIIENLENIETKTAKSLEGIYDVIVMDPPWPMQKIERDERPNQSEFDYPTMSEDELSSLNIPAANNCHLWVWTTQKFLPMAFRLLNDWNSKYVCTFVWHKPGGFQPVGLPQYNCEFVLYARIGTPVFVDTKALPTCFNAPRGKHSEKPEEFYDMVRRVTAGRKLDMFGRKPIDGFDSWGNEIE